MVKKAAIGIFWLAQLLVCARADSAAGGTPAGDACRTQLSVGSGDGWNRAPTSAGSSTKHKASVGAEAFEYTATAGLLAIRDDGDRPIANIGYVAYTRDVAAPSRRPIVFAFNGGPGASSVWLHMGMLGPKRILLADAASTPPASFEIVANQFSLLDRADLVLIDPVGTGFSRAVCGKADQDFWGVDSDVDSIGRFIAQYTTDNRRWLSPKYLFGESYGTARAAALVNYLRLRRNVSFSGVILMSVITDLQVQSTDLQYPMSLPTLAAVAWYHRKVPASHADLGSLVEEVRSFAAGPYSAALFAGDSLTSAERERVAQKLHEYIGLPVDYLKAANLRVTAGAFLQELLRAEGKIVGRLDARFAGIQRDPLQRTVDFDPSWAGTIPALTASLLDYYHGDLKFGDGMTYQIVSFAAGGSWKWSHKVEQSEQTVMNTGVDLAQALVQDEALRVLVLSGYYDLATPFSSADYMMSHLGLPPAAASRIEKKYYEAGHMVYMHPPSLRKLKSDLDRFIESTSGRER